jgi:hypothetical protein
MLRTRGRLLLPALYLCDDAALVATLAAQMLRLNE